MNFISAKKNFNIDSNQFRISRTDFVNSKCNAFFKWFTTDAQICSLGISIAKNLIKQESLHGREIRVDLTLEYMQYSLFVIFTKKSDTFFDIKITNFIKTSKADTLEIQYPHMVLHDYSYAYKLVPRGTSHFHCVSNLEAFKYKVYFSGHLIFKKEPFFNKYNFQKLSSDILKYLLETDLAPVLSDGTPLHVIVQPNVVNETVNHKLHVTCSLWYNEKEEGGNKYYFLVDNVHYLSFSNIRKNAFKIDKVFELSVLKVINKKDKPSGLKIIKKGNSK